MTYPGENPFEKPAEAALSDEAIAAFFDGEIDRAIEEETRNHRGSLLLQRMQDIVDQYGLPRVFDESLEREDELEELRMQTIREQVTEEVSASELAGELVANDSFMAVIELQSMMQLIAERRFQQVFASLSMRLTDTYDNASPDDKERVLADVIYEKKVYIALLTGHYGFDLAGWPAAFDEITPGTAIGLNVDGDSHIYKHEADATAKRIEVKEAREKDERDTLARMVEAELINDPDRLTEVMICLAVIQEEVDVIQLFHDINAQELRLEAICNICDQAGFSDEMCQRIVSYYNQKHAIAA